MEKWNISNGQQLQVGGLWEVMKAAELLNKDSDLLQYLEKSFHHPVFGISWGYLNLHDSRFLMCCLKSGPHL